MSPCRKKFLQVGRLRANIIDTILTMKSRLSFLTAVGLPGVMLFLGACAHVPHIAIAPVNVTHVAPGQSLDVALARKPELVRLPAPAHPVAAHQTGVAGPVASVEPDLPKSDNAAR